MKNNSIRSILKKLGLVNTFFIIYLILCLLAYLIIGRNICLWLMWNSFLGWVAFIFIQLFARYPRAWIFLILGVLFLPNAFYIITDFIHVNNLGFYRLLGYSRVLYIENITPWVELFIISLGAIFGWVVGLKSINTITQKLPPRLKKFKLAKKIGFSQKFTGKLIIPLTLSLLSGFGIWIGRFLRLNSWDIFRPLLLIEYIISRVNWFAVVFTSLFTFFIFASYLVVYKINLKRLFDKEN
ncbi:DUF1361 domain-containing protein [Candidatus Saccharibacteria bacterium]|nr:DUF1361 domain-containing protein [Candidatus Saccharibacteria bacterium]